MIEKLMGYKEMFAKKIAELENESIDVEEEVMAFRVKRLAEENAKREAQINKLKTDIDCIDEIIAHETSSEEAHQEEQTTESESEI